MKRYHEETYIARRKIQEERIRVVLISHGLEEWFHLECMRLNMYFL